MSKSCSIVIHGFTVVHEYAERYGVHLDSVAFLPCGVVHLACDAGFPEDGSISLEFLISRSG